MKLFLDTMIWLHYKQIDDIDWSTLLPDRTSPTVVIPRITTREMDKHKNSHRSGAVKARARKWLATFAELQTGGATTLKNGVVLELFLAQPKCDFPALGLDHTSSDDMLLGTILDYQTQHQQDTVRLFSADATPRLIATHLGIDATEFPETFKLEEELDPTAKELRDLKAEIDRAKHARPVLSGRFHPEAQSYLRLYLEEPPPFPEDRIAVALEDFNERHPLADVGGTSGINYSLQAIIRPIREESERYNREVKNYPRAFRAFAREAHKIASIKKLGTAIDFRIVNTGKSPAEDIDVFLTFPGMCLIIEEYPKSPEPPKEPERPTRGLSAASFQLPILEPLVMPPFAQQPADERFSIEESEKGCVVRKHFKRIKHGHFAGVDRFYLSFRDFASAASFNVECRITAANLLEPVVLTLNVQVSK